VKKKDEGGKKRGKGERGKKKEGGTKR